MPKMLLIFKTRFTIACMKDWAIILRLFLNVILSIILFLVLSVVITFLVIFFGWNSLKKVNIESNA